jgi:hypothetical protein
LSAEFRFDFRKVGSSHRPFEDALIIGQYRPPGRVSVPVSQVVGLKSPNFQELTIFRSPEKVKTMKIESNWSQSLVKCRYWSLSI